MSEEEIKNLRIELKKHTNLYNDALKLANDPTNPNYVGHSDIELNKKIKKLASIYHELLDQYKHARQENCEHPIWILVHSGNIIDENKRTVICQCLKCKIYVQDEINYFSDKLLGLVSLNNKVSKIERINEINPNDYAKLEDEGYNDEEIVKKLFLKYKKKK